MSLLETLDRQIADEHASFEAHLGRGADSWSHYWLSCAAHEVRLGRLLGIRAATTKDAKDAEWAAHYRQAARVSLAQAEESLAVTA